jgi:anti-sigma factor RsiW
MNCLDARRLIARSPAALPVEVDRHVEACAGCSEHLLHVLRADARLRDAMRVNVPPALADRVILAHARHRRARRLVRRLALLAAGTILACASAALLFPEPNAGAAHAAKPATPHADEP